MQMKPQTSEHVNSGVLISLDRDRYSHGKFLWEFCHLPFTGNGKLGSD